MRWKPIWFPDTILSELIKSRSFKEMETRIVKAYGDESRDKELMEEAGRLIRAGELVGMHFRGAGGML